MLLRAERLRRDDKAVWAENISFSLMFRNPTLRTSRPKAPSRKSNVIF